MEEIYKSFDIIIFPLSEWKISLIDSYATIGEYLCNQRIQNQVFQM